MNKIEFGLRNVVYSKITEDASTGVISYGTVKSFLADGCGAKNINLAPTGNDSTYYADDVIWDEESTNNGYDGDLTMTDLSDDFKKDILGMTVDTNGALTEHADAVMGKFALGFEVQGNKTQKRTWYLYCSCGRTNDEHASNEDVKSYAEPSLSLKARPRPTDRKVKTSMTKTSTNESAFSTFFSTVYEEQSSSI